MAPYDKLTFAATTLSSCLLADGVRRIRIRLGIVIACFLAVGGSLAAPSKAGKPSESPLVSLNAVLERSVQSVRNVRWHDLEHLVGDFKEPESGNSVAHLIAIDGTLGKPLGGGELTSASPDGRILLQHTDDGWLVRDLDLGETVRIDEPADESRAFTSCCPPVWSRDGRYAAIVDRYRPRRSPNAPEAMTIAGVPVIDVSRQAPITDRWFSCVTIFDRSQLAVVQRILVDYTVGGMVWGADHTLFVTQIDMFGDEAATAVLRIRPHSQQPAEIYHSSGRFETMTPAVNPDGTMIALVLDVDNRTWSDFESILLIDASSGKELGRLTHDLPIRGFNYIWSAQGEKIYAAVRNGGLDQIYEIPLHGEPRQLTRGPRQHFGMDLSPEGHRLSYQTRDGYGRKDVRVLDLDTGKEEVILVVDEPAREFKLGEWQQIRWDSTDGVKPFGYLITPPDFNPDRQYPMIVYVHGGGPGSTLGFGGPMTLGVAGGALEWHAWAALGYVVFIPDYRSTGDYGPDVITARYKAGEIPAIKDIEDVVSGTRHVIDQGFVNPLRVAIFGHSAGGARVYVLLTKYDFYAAAILNEAIPPDPVSRFIGATSGEFTGHYAAGIIRQNYGGDLAEVPDRLKANYMFDSYRNNTPTLIMVGNEKLGGVDHMPNEVLYSILRQRGVPTRMLKFVNEGHNYSRPESAKLAFEEVHRWLETHMPANGE